MQASMKKLSHKQKQRLVRLAILQKRRRASSRRRIELRRSRATSTVFTGEKMRRVRSRREPYRAPEVLCFDRNPGETLHFLNQIRRRLLSSFKIGNKWLPEERSEGGIVEIPIYIDFRTIRFISTAAALVLAAEYDRAQQLSGVPPPVFDLDQWSPEVFETLFRLGFFHTVGLAKFDGEPRPVVNEDAMMVRFLSGSGAADLKKADEMLLELGRFIDPDQQLPDEIAIPLNSALSEAMVNVGMHAYPTDHRFQYRHIGRWWMTGSADRGNRKLTVVIYDQGASIPVTFDKLPKHQEVMEFIKGAIASLTGRRFTYESDAVHIEAAMRYGNSQSASPNRGKGLPQMQEAIDAAGNGHLLVISRCGRYQYSGGRIVERRQNRRSVGGTLIEWTIRLPSKSEVTT